jgi:hypothetical protein
MTTVWCCLSWSVQPFLGCCAVILLVVAFTVGISEWGGPGMAGFSFQTPMLSYLNMHPLLMLCGSVLFLFNASSLFRGTPRRRFVCITHAFMNSVALITMVLGGVVVYRYKQQNVMSHISTPHSVLGLVTLILLSLQVTSALSLTLCRPCPAGAWRWWKPIHIVFGVFLVVSSGAAIVSGTQAYTTMLLSTYPFGSHLGSTVFVLLQYVGLIVVLLSAMTLTRLTTPPQQQRQQQLEKQQHSAVPQESVQLLN